MTAAVAATVITATCVAGVFGVRAATVGAKKRLLPIYSVDRVDDCVSISFDCAWGVEHTDDILDALDKFGVKCTFFAVEFWVRKYPEYCKKIIERGHEIGTHSKTHPKMSTLSREKIVEELTSSKSAIEEITGRKVILFRPPFGDYDDGVISMATSLGLYSVQWDVDSLDWKDLSARDIAARVLSKTKSGSIILCHNNGLHTAESLPLIFGPLIAQGKKFVKISDLIYLSDYEMQPDGTQKQVDNANN